METTNIVDFTHGERIRGAIADLLRTGAAIDTLAKVIFGITFKEGVETTKRSHHCID